jgi:hypothetical protein
MLNHIDLRPILANPAAAEILLLARGQLNRAFRSHGLVPPDPLAPSDAEGIEPMELDDPAAQGIDHAMAKFRENFIAWAGAMPAKLVPPVLDILRQAHEALAHEALAHEALDGPQDAANAAAVAVQAAHDFLSGCLHPDLGCSDATRSRMGSP